jgi:hypothetical protein
MAPEPVFQLDVQGKQDANDAVIPGDSQHQFHLLPEIQAAEAVPDVLVDPAVPPGPSGGRSCRPALKRIVAVVRFPSATTGHFR